MKESKQRVPGYAQLIEATFLALKELGGSGKNNEINAKAIEIIGISDAVLAIPHLNSSSLSEVDYRLAWARTLLKNYGAYIEKNCRKKAVSSDTTATPEQQMEEAGVEVPEEARPWRKKLHNVLVNMNPYSFEKLTQRLLRECGFEDVHVTKKSGDGGIDGTGKLKINGIFSFNIAFQCKRYQGSVGAAEIRDFRGSLTTDIEKGVFITTGSFSKPAIAEASTPGKHQIDLMDGEEFITKLAEYGIGVHEIKDYEVDEEYFAKI